jgi:hypothetical protein
LALAKGKFAVFAGTGLGKTAWADPGKKPRLKCSSRSQAEGETTKDGLALIFLAKKA